jgi:hypothetical protein
VITLELLLAGWLLANACGGGSGSNSPTVTTTGGGTEQLWSGVLDPTRATDWTNQGVNSGIPTRATICATLSPPGITEVQINAAIAACPANQVVFLTAGTYTLGAGIDFGGHSNVTLRGAGPHLTKITFSVASACVGLGGNVCVLNPSGINPDNPPNVANWTAGYSVGTTTITLDSTTGLVVGSLIFLDQLMDSNVDNGQMWMCDAPGICSTEGGVGLTRSNPSRGQVHTAVVTSINGLNVTIDRPLIDPNWRSSQTPQAWWTNDTIHGVGIEDLSLDYTNAIGSNGIFFGGAYDVWVKNVRSINTARAHVLNYTATRITVRDSYFYGTQDTGSQSYGVETDSTSGLLVENNIFQHVAVPVVQGKGAVGNVYGYNFAIDDFYCASEDWQQADMYWHNSDNDYTLFEGNDGIGFNADNIHGTSFFGTAFRNFVNGRDPAGCSVSGKSAQTNGVIIQANNRYFNFIGNVLGTGNYHNNYECYPLSSTDASCTQGTSDLSIYSIGWSSNGGTKFSGLPNDPLVRSSMMRWGNYDTVNNAVRFLSTEVPSGISPYGNAVPASQTLPASFYLSLRPTTWWITPWSTPPWPSIGPDVTGGNVVSGSGAASALGGHVYKIPARLCYENTPIDSAYGSNNVLLFNATTCYI